MHRTTIVTHLLLALVASVGRAQTRDASARVDADALTADAPSDDYLLPGAGRFSTSVATGIPYLAIGEVAIGLSRGFALGAIAGVTPNVVGFGLRPRGALVDDGATRLFVIAPTFYYPATNDLGGDPWVLTYPTARLEHDWGGVRVHAGLGVVFAACVESLGLVAADDDEGFMGGVWNTALVGAALPLGDGHEIFADASLVLSGLEIPSAWVGGPPVVFSLGTTWNL